MHTTLDTYIIAALERLAETEAQAARTARAANLPDDAKFFQRSANAYARALCHFLAGVRPEPTPNGYILPSQRVGEAPHKLHKDGDWVCTCPSGGHIHWASALIVGIEVAHDDMERMDGDDGEPIEESPLPPTPITITTAPGGLAFSRRGLTQFITDPADVAGAIARLTSGADARALGARLAQARARIAA